MMGHVLHLSENSGGIVDFSFLLFFSGLFLPPSPPPPPPPGRRSSTSDCTDMSYGIPILSYLRDSLITDQITVCWSNNGHTLFSKSGLAVAVRIFDLNVKSTTALSAGILYRSSSTWLFSCWLFSLVYVDMYYKRPPSPPPEKKRDDHVACYFSAST